MKLTNLSGLPDALVRAVANDPYSKGGAEFSITELISPARQGALKAQFKDDIEEDVEDRLYSLYGQMIHGILERANGADLAEKRFFGTIAGARVSGQIDTLELVDGVLSDWKFTTSWGFKKGQEPKPEWTMQLNFQLELMRQNNQDAKTLQIVGLLRDFSKLEAMRDENYPRKSVQIQSIEMWPRERTVREFENRVNLHRQARVTLPLCTPEERWARPDKFAVMKIGAARATKLHETRQQAEEHAATDKKFFVQDRPGESIRCSAYCNVAQFCTQRQMEVDTNDSA